MPDDRQRHQRARKKRERRMHSKDKQRPSGGASALPAPGEFWSEMPVVLELAPKLSEALIDFAEPLLERLPEGAELKTFQGAFNLASAIWNALAAEEDSPIDGAVRLDTIKQAMAPELPASAFDDLVNTLRWRKATHFPGDRRLVVSVAVEERGDRMQVRALASMA